MLILVPIALGFGLLYQLLHQILLLNAFLAYLFLGLGNIRRDGLLLGFVAGFGLLILFNFRSGIVAFDIRQRRLVRQIHLVLSRHKCTVLCVIAA